MKRICPNCGAEAYYRYGKILSGKQRYICLVCGHQYTEGSARIRSSFRPSAQFVASRCIFTGERNNPYVLDVHSILNAAHLEKSPPLPLIATRNRKRGAMISSSYDLKEFMVAVRHKDPAEVITLAEKEALYAWRKSYTERKNSKFTSRKAKHYEFVLKEFAQYVRSGVRLPIHREMFPNFLRTFREELQGKK